MHKSKTPLSLLTKESDREVKISTKSRTQTSRMSPTQKKTTNSGSERAIERFCQDYLDDRLSATQRKVVEERISKGDKLIIETLERLQGESANIKRAKSSEDRYQEDLASLGLSQDKRTITPPTASIHDASATQTKKTKKSSREAFKAMIKGPKTIFSLFIASMIMLLTVLIIYLQSERTRLHTQLVSQQKITEEAKLSAFSARSAALEQTDQYVWLKNLIRQEGLVQQNVFLADFTNSPTQVLFHPPSLKLAMIAGEWKLPDGKQLSVWTTGTAEPQLLGMMYPLKKDSLYRNWNTAALLIVENLEFRVGTIAEGVIDYNESTLLISTPLP